jgi:hypothetical protein
MGRKISDNAGDDFQRLFSGEIKINIIHSHHIVKQKAQILEILLLAIRPASKHSPTCQAVTMRVGAELDCL